MNPQPYSPVSRYQQSLSPYKPPSSFKQYQVLKRLHHTQNSGIYLVMPSDARDRLVLKVVSKPASSKVQLFEALAEQCALSQVGDSPQFTRLVRSWHDSRHFYFVLDYYPETLADTLSGPSFDISRARVYAAGILTALKHLHSRHIVHRDLTPFNVFFRSDGQVVLGGLSKSAILKPDPLAGARSNMFEPLPLSASKVLEYMSPERLSGKRYSFEVDTWSFGVLVYRMVTGRLPFKGNTADELRMSVREDEVSFPDHKDIDAATQDLVQQLLCKNLKKRLTSIEDIQKHHYFRFIDWSTIILRRTISPWKPAVSGYPVIHHPPHMTAISPGSPYIAHQGLLDPHPRFTFENDSPACLTTEDLYPQAYRNLPSTNKTVTRPRCVTDCLPRTSDTSMTEPLTRKRSLAHQVQQGLGILM